MSKTQRNKGSLKRGCCARMRINFKKCFDIFPKEWHVTVFVKEHNHAMLSQEEMCFLPANRKVTLSIGQIIRVMELEKNLKQGELPYFERDILNIYEKVKRMLGTFVTIMKKSPNTIITDQDPWMSEAISSEMSTTKHSFCIWHITLKVSCWFVALLRNDYQKWCANFYGLYKMTIPEEFEFNWLLMHVLGLYKVRHFWAPAYFRDYFFGGMITTGRSESINAFIKRFISSHICLTDFVKQLHMAVEEISQGRSHNKVIATLKPVSLNTKSPLEKQASELNTVKIMNSWVNYFEGNTTKQHSLLGWTYNAMQL
ncbi:Protein FAR1-RELATED SEQUENCE 11 [Bienertia sinuspersici]